MAELKKILLIGGTSDAVQLNSQLFALDNVVLLTSLAGRTKNPVPLKGEVLFHGFGDGGGLEEILKTQGISCVIDASHPFAAKIKQKAAQICEQLNVQYLRYDRPKWEQRADDIWISAPDLQSAAYCLADFKRIFLTIGRQELAVFEEATEKEFLVRSIEPVSFDPQSSTVTEIQDRGPFSKMQEMALIQEYNIDVVVSKNSGGMATIAKIDAARALSVPVIMVERPGLDRAQSFNNMDDLIRQMQLSV